ncbi:HD domain-containing protein [Streptomyces sp. ZL-24]|uniref:HD domain-containing protein n=1 Tax=Streptomyces sp. ZL-24 TaxID=1933029 RepID=UPI000CD475D1|nr:HD domain-containing protein [Streptomyces sp. ZL-24]
MAGDDLSAVGRFLYEAGTLRHARRIGWWMAGVRDPESVAEHSWRTALIATIIAKLEGADPARAAYLAVWHDTQESRTGDVNHLGKKYAPAGDPQEVTADQTAGMPEVLASAVHELIAEYEAKESPEAVCARDADKLECVLQGIEYKAQGHFRRTHDTLTAPRHSRSRPMRRAVRRPGHAAITTVAGIAQRQRVDAPPTTASTSGCGTA